MRTPPDRDMESIAEHIKDKHPDMIADKIDETTIEPFKVALANAAICLITNGYSSVKEDSEGFDEVLDRYIHEAAIAIVPGFDEKSCCQDDEHREY